jgi:minor extracellular serine protease Vpr
VTLYNYLWSDVFTVPLAPASPGSFGILDQSFALVGASNAAKRGQVIQIFANGLGPVNNHPASGDPAPATLLTCNANPSVTIGGLTAGVQFCGLAPGFVGLYQLNVTVPANAPAGTQQLVISMGGNTATISLPVQ